MNGAAIVAAARAWVGTPFGHQGRVLGERIDCAGLIAKTGQAAGLTTYDVTDYGMQPNPKRMKAILDRELILIPINEARAGDVFWMVYGGRQPRHLAIFTGASIIHAYQDAGKCVEHILDEDWRRRIRAAYRYPGVD